MTTFSTTRQADKRILIHIGPAKTGSSAIQKWLSENQDTLKKSGIFYPSHGLDENGVSSGNNLAIFSQAADHKLTLDMRRVDELVKIFYQSEYKCLLLSSEFFFKHVELIANAIPNCEFIAYIRSPLDYFESIYNQSVKRHNNSKKLHLPRQLVPRILNKLSESIDRVGAERFILRSYLPHSQLAGGLIQDFLNIIGMTVPIDLEKQKAVNSSYCHEALQLKRLLNKNELGELVYAVDHTLQKYDIGTQHYSYVPKEIYESYRKQCIESLRTFSLKYDVYEAEWLIERTINRSQKAFLEQVLTVSKAEALRTFIKETDGMLYLMLCDSLSRQVEVEVEIAEDSNNPLQSFVADAPPWSLHNWFNLMAIKGISSGVKLRFIFSKLKALHFPKSEDKLNVFGLNRLKSNLGLEDSFSNLDLIREIALFAEANKDYQLAYRLLRKLQVHRPSSALVNYKLGVISSKLDKKDIRNKNK
jgi:hypothetical protein